MAPMRGRYMKAPTDLVVFLGPSLPAAEARALADCRILPPAKAGDVFAILPSRPLAIALVDGVFEGAPSVWHHELLAALDAGIAVFGGASMGALRAAELWPLGVVGVGTVFGWYRDGVLVDDDEVAVYHAPAERGSRPFTVPLVDVRHAAALAVERGIARNRDAAAIVSAAAALHFGERRWERILGDAKLSRRARLLLAPFLRSAPSLKAQDARATIRSAAEWVAARRAGAPPLAPRLPPLPSHARRRRLAEARSLLADGTTVRGAEVLTALGARADARRNAADGLRHALLAAFARSLGLRANTEQVERAERAWLGSAGGRARAGRLAALGLDDGAARALFEDLALEALLLDRSAKVVPDGPSFEEGLALSARLSGAWREEVERLARPSSTQRHPASASASASPPRARPPRARAAPTGASPRRPPSRRPGE
jgi:hypothetical protein